MPATSVRRGGGRQRPRNGLIGPAATRAAGRRALLDPVRRLSPQPVECLVGIGYGLGVDVVGGSTVGDLSPVGSGEHSLDREYLGG